MDQYLVQEKVVDGAGTHVLIIGAGDYLHLIGGSGQLSQNHEGMEQLTSPPVSARMLAEWFIRSFRNPDQPLASVALLLSERPRAKFTNPVSGAEISPATTTYDNVAEAINGWRKRGRENPGNLLIFYFCGHGIAQGSDMTLLMSDYGKTESPLDHALDFRRFRLAMSRNHPARQIYFIDACRASTDTLISAFGYAGRLPVQSAEEGPAEAPVFYATLAGKKAYGRPNQPSLFTEALLKGLQGAGSDDSEGDWRVTTTRLKEAIDYFMLQGYAAGERRVQVPPTDELTTFPIHYLDGKPEVPVVVTCRPETENQSAEFICRFQGAERGRRAPEAAPWTLTLPVGLYEFIAEFPAGGRARKAAQAYVRPVYRKVPLQ